jgi:hypothetical protein
LHAAWSDSALRVSVACAGRERVKRYDAPIVAGQFLDALIAP